jgi:hypothetical protein
MSLIISFSECVSASLLEWLSSKALLCTDTAFCNLSLRIDFLGCLRNTQFVIKGDDITSLPSSYIDWIILRGIKISSFNLSFHWFCSNKKMTDLKSINNNEIRNLHINTNRIESIVIEQTKKHARLNKNQIFELINSCKKLRRLILNGFDTYFVLNNISSDILQNLTHFSSTFEKEDDFTVVAYFSKWCTNLKHLNISHRDNGLSILSIITSNKFLKTLLIGADITDDRFFSTIAQSCKFLTMIEIHQCQLVKFSHFSFLLTTYPKATLIKFSYAYTYTNDFDGKTLECLDDYGFSCGIIFGDQLMHLLTFVVDDLTAIKLTGNHLRYNCHFFMNLFDRNPRLQTLELQDFHGDIRESFLKFMFQQCKFFKQIILWDAKLDFLLFLKTNYVGEFCLCSIAGDGMGMGVEGLKAEFVF